MAQLTNDKMQRNLEAHFLPVRRHVRNGARILNALTQLNIDSGGKIRYAWSANQAALIGTMGAVPLPEINVSDVDYYTVPDRGGPYVALDGATQYLALVDAAWQEPVANPFCLWAWCKADSFAADHRVVLAKWNRAANLSYRLLRAFGAAAFQFSTSTDGAATIAATSTYPEVIDTWYFAAGAWVPSTAQGQFVAIAAAADTDLTIDYIAGNSSATIFDGNSPLLVGCQYAGGAPEKWWDGGIGDFQMRTVPWAGVTSYLRRCFHETKWFYGG